MIRRSYAAVALCVLALSACGDGSGDRQTPSVALAADGRTPATPTAEPAVRPVGGEVVTVYKSATCGCCKAWVAHMEAAGFQVEAHDVDDLAEVKTKHGVPPEHQSCHTAVVGAYVVEGHVPADVVRRLLEERPEIAGLAVPGMPRGSPGMEMPDGTADDYEVIAFRADGSSTPYAKP